jgi:hypothetical protein
MSMSDLETGLRYAAEHPDEADFEGPRDDALVAAAEAALGLTFPPTYRRFLRELGAGDLGTREFYGVIDDDWSSPGPPDAIGTTLHERREWQLPERFVIVAETGDGAWYVLDTAQAGAGGEAPVLVWTSNLSSLDDPPERAADDFGAFFAESVRR